MKMIIKILNYSFLLLGLILFQVFTSCDFLQDEDFGEWKDESLVWDDFNRVRGVLNEVYENLDGDWMDEIGYSMDFNTDNAVDIDKVSRYASGGWTVSSSPHNSWQSCYNNIRIINSYLERGTKTPFMPSDPEIDNLVRSRYYGEAFFLRAWNEWILLKEYGGPVDVAGTDIQGFPIVTEVLENEEYIKIPRSSYEECVQQIINDCDTAMAYLPKQYDDSNNSVENQYLGDCQRGRACKLGAMALKARVALYAASPLFNPDNDPAKWERTVRFAADVIEIEEGLQDLSDFGEFDNTDNADDYWRTSFRSDNDLEKSNFPASLFGNGTCNPSQNLVDAFPMANGYPKAHPKSGYDPTAPYEGRDKRFNSFIFHNGDSDYSFGYPIETYEGGADASGGLNLIGTRTGYYMKKFMAKVNLDPNASDATKEKDKFAVYLGRAELYLNFAEAANEVYGPTANVTGVNITAKDALAKIRKRAGIPADDSYLEDVASAGKNAFRNLVKNERRLEFCFEWYRFFDLRRWKDELNRPVLGAKITKNDDGSFSYKFDVEVEKRDYKDHMYYGPIPYDEVLKAEGTLVQNYGW